MNNELRILILEDDEIDAQLLQRVLKKTELHFITEVVQTREAYEIALDAFDPDLIISDYSLPSFDGATAFRIKQDKKPLIPFIIISGSLGEENAVELIKCGVTDFAPKDKLFQLGPKITRALKEAEEKKENKEANERFSLASRASRDIIYEWKISDNTVWWNDGYYTIMGIKKEKEEWLDPASWSNCIHPDDYGRIMDCLNAFLKSKKLFWSNEYRFLDHKGKVYYFVDKGCLVRDQNGEPLRMIGAVADITHLQNHITQLKEMLFMTSHRVRHPIANILGLSNALDDSINDPAELKEILDYIKLSAIKLEEFTHELNNFITNSKDKAENRIKSL